MKYTILFAALFAAFGAAAQTQSPTIGGNGNLDQQVIGDTQNSADHTASTSNQLGNSANNNGASISVPTDIRTQISPNMDSTATGGAATGNLSNNDNKSQASNGNQTMGQANTGTVGNTTSSSGGNVLGGANSLSGGNTMTGGANTAAGGAGGQGGAGGLAAQGQQQGIDRSGNSANANTMTGGANTATGGASGVAGSGNSANRNTQGQLNAQGQVNGQTTTAGNGAGASAGAGAGANAGSGNRTSNTTRVDASDRSVTNNSYKAVAWAPIINGPAAPALAAANLVVIPGQCGPRVRVVASNVVGKQFGPFGGQYDVVQGQDTDTVMAQGADGQYEPYIILGDDVWGQRVDRAIGALGTSSSTNFSIGGFTSKGDAAQGGAGGSGSLQQIVARSFVTDCVIGKVIKPAPQPQIVFETALPQRAARSDRN